MAEGTRMVETRSNTMANMEHAKDQQRLENIQSEVGG